jgi:hypothetical protein
VSGRCAGVSTQDAGARHEGSGLGFLTVKDWRRIATRYDRCAKVFLSAYALAAVVMFWL